MRRTPQRCHAQVADVRTDRCLRRRPDEFAGGRHRRQPGRQFTYGKVMCWLALQRTHDLVGDPDGRLEKTCAAVRERIFAEGLRRNKHGEYLAVDIGRHVVDASEFLIIPSGVLSSALARSTREAIECRLAVVRCSTARKVAAKRKGSVSFAASGGSTISRRK